MFRPFPLAPGDPRSRVVADFLSLGQHETLDGPTQGSFLDRERALLGEDAEQFGAIQDHTNNAATVEDDDGDLLGGDNFGGDNRATTVGDEMNDFENFFPAIDSQNEVSRYSFTLPGSARSGAWPVRPPLEKLLASRLQV
jgi:Clathrin light chain